MLYRKNDTWLLCDKRLTYKTYGQECTVLSGDIAWWQAASEKWTHVEIVHIEDVTYTPEQRQRYEHIKYMPEDFDHLYAHYVEFGEVLEDVVLLPQHPFNIIMMKHREIAATTDYLLDIDFRLMMIEFGMI